jgi:hypothetical protein
MKPSEQISQIREMLRDIEGIMLDPQESPAPKPYYYDERTNTFRKHPWHYVFFSQLGWYRRLVGGEWYHLDESVWVRVKRYNLT